MSVDQAARRRYGAGMSTVTWGPAVQRVAKTLGWAEQQWTEQDQAEFRRRMQLAADEAVAYYGADKALREPVTREEIRALHGL